MEIDTQGNRGGFPEHRRVFPGRVHLTSIIAALICLILTCISFGLAGGNSYAQALLIKTPTPTPTFTPTPTATFTPTPTFTPTFTPTPTSTPTPAPTATHTPEATPTARATVNATPTVKATPTHVKPTPTAAKTATSSADQTPTALAGAPTTATGNSTPSTGQANQALGGSFFSPFITGSLIFLGMAGALLLGFLTLRKRILPPQPVKINLPPSGAQPWKRVRSASFHGNTNAAGKPLEASEPTWSMPASMGLMTPGTNNASPAALEGNQQEVTAPLFLFPQSNGGFLISNPGGQQNGFPNNSPVVLTADGPGPITDQVKTKPPARPTTRPIRLKKQEMDGADLTAEHTEQWEDRNSEELPSLDASLLKDIPGQHPPESKPVQDQQDKEEN